MSRFELPDRRTALKPLGAGAVGAGAIQTPLFGDEPHKVKGNIKQSICRWCYNGIKLEKLAEEAGKRGKKSIELLSPEASKKVKESAIPSPFFRSQSRI